MAALPLQVQRSLATVCNSGTRCAARRWLTRRAYHSSALCFQRDIPEKSVSSKIDEKKTTPLPPIQLGGYNTLIDLAKQRTGMEKQEQFAMALNEFVRREKYRKGHVAFIRVAMQRMEEFNLEKNLESYNRLIDVFPRGRFAPRRMIDAFWPRSTPQLELCLEILTKMEENGVVPTEETYDIIEAVFGVGSLPLQKCARIVKLFHKFEDMDPYEVRSELPTSQTELSRLALFRMSGKDAELTQIEVPDDGRDMFIISGNSDKQLKLLERLESDGLSDDVFLHVEGPHRLWLKKTKQYYFTLRLSEGSEELSHSIGQSIDEDVVLGMCMCQPASQESLHRWIRELQERYTCLAKASIIYDISKPEKEHRVQEQAKIG